MAAPSVFVTRPIPEAGIARLAADGLRIQVHALAESPTHSELLSEIGLHDAVICQVTDRIDASALEAARPRCRIVAACTAGYDNIDVAAARRCGIVVTNTPDELTEATADLTWALLLAAARRLGESERVVRSGAWRGWGMLDFLGTEIFGGTLGIIGAGRIGAAVARRAAGFSVNVLYHARSPKPELDRLGARSVPLRELLQLSDFVSVHVPLSEDTRRLLGAAAIESMKSGAVLINTSRGDVVDEDALIEALESGRLAAAGLDVYPNEPHVHPALLRLENVVLLPHIGSATRQTRSRMARRAADNVCALLRGDPPLDPVTS